MVLWMSFLCNRKLWLVLAFIGVCVSAVVNLYCVEKGLVGLLLGAMLVCTIIWYRTQYMNYIILGIAEFVLVGVLAAGSGISDKSRDGYPEGTGSAYEVFR